MNPKNPLPIVDWVDFLWEPIKFLLKKKNYNATYTTFYHNHNWWLSIPKKKLALLLSLFLSQQLWLVVVKNAYVALFKKISDWIMFVGSEMNPQKIPMHDKCSEYVCITCSIRHIEGKTYRKAMGYRPLIIDGAQCVGPILKFPINDLNRLLSLIFFSWMAH